MQLIESTNSADEKYNHLHEKIFMAVGCDVDDFLRLLEGHKSFVLLQIPHLIKDVEEICHLLQLSSSSDDLGSKVDQVVAFVREHHTRISKEDDRSKQSEKVSRVLEKSRSLCGGLKISCASDDVLVVMEAIEKELKNKELQMERFIAKIGELETFRAQHMSNEEDEVDGLSLIDKEEVANQLQQYKELVQDQEKAAGKSKELTEKLMSEVSAVGPPPPPSPAALQSSVLRATIQELQDELDDREKEVQLLKGQVRDLTEKVEDARRYAQEVKQDAAAEAEERFAQEVLVLRGALERLKSQVAQTSEDNEVRGQEVEILEDELQRLREDKEEVRSFPSFSVVFSVLILCPGRASAV
eukprot:758306-Hanusia_phi.AAC.1